MILSFMNDLGVVDVRLLKAANIDGLGNTSNRNILRVIRRLEEEKLVKSMRKEIKLFTTSDGTFHHWEHHLLRNRFIVDKGIWKQVIIEPKVTVKGETFIPDFVLPLVPHPHRAEDYIYFEVDRLQKKKTNHEKIARYKRLGLKVEIVCRPERVYIWKGSVYHTVTL